MKDLDKWLMHMTCSKNIYTHSLLIRNGVKFLTISFLTLKSLLEERSLLSKQGGILMKNDEANRALLREQGKHFERQIRENRAKQRYKNISNASLTLEY